MLVAPKQIVLERAYSGETLPRNFVFSGCTISWNAASMFRNGFPDALQSPPRKRMYLCLQHGLTVHMCCPVCHNELGREYFN